MGFFDFVGDIADVAGDIGDVAGGVGSVMGLFGGGSGRDYTGQLISQNAALQREFAQNGIRWKVEDAKAAGVHPLFALGAPTMSFNPAQVFPSDESSLSSRLSIAGQDISRAVDSTRTKSERIGSRMEALALERGELQNELLRSQIARLNQQSGPPSPSVASLSRGSGTGLIEEKPLERSASFSGAPHTEAGAVNDLGFARTRTGLAPVPSSDVKQRIEDNLIPELMWSLRNNVLPNLGMGTPPPHGWLPEGAYRWRWNPFRQEWDAVFPDPDRTPMQGRTIRLPD